MKINSFLNRIISSLSILAVLAGAAAVRAATILTATNNPMVPIYQTIPGGNSTASANGNGVGQWPTGEELYKAFDTNTATKYLNFGGGTNPNGTTNAPGVNCGFYITPTNASVLSGFSFTAGNDSANRDPLTISIEGTLATANLDRGSNWILIADNIPTGMATDPGRNGVVATQTVSSAFVCTSYRVIVRSVRGTGQNSMQFDELRMLGNAPATGAPVIGLNPSNQVVMFENQTPAPFTVGVTSGTLPYTFFWYSNNVFIAGATNCTYVPPPAGLSMQGAAYKVVVSNSVGTATSSAGTLTIVNLDISRPGDAIVGFPAAVTGHDPAWPLAEPPSFAIDNTVTAASKYLNFGITNTGLIIAPAAASSNVVIRMGLISGGDAQERDPSSFKLEGGITNAASTNWVLIASNSVGAFATRLLEQDLPITNNIRYPIYRWSVPTVYNPATANSMQITEVLLIGTNVTGPPILTANLSNLVVAQLQPANFQVWVGNGVQPYSYQWYSNSVAIAGATDFAYTIPSATTNMDQWQYYVVVTNSLGSVTSAVATLTVAAEARITSSPTNLTVNEYQTATFNVSAVGYAPLAYQWYTNGFPALNATNSSYTTPAVAPSPYNGMQFYVVVTNTYGNVTSTVAMLTVVTDVVPPTVLSVREDNTGLAQVAARIRVVFSEPVTPASSTNLANYVLSGNTLITNAVYLTNAVVLYASNLVVGNSYTLSLQGITDLAQAPNTITPNPTNFAFRVYAAITNGVVRREWFTNLATGPNNAVTSLLASVKYTNNRPDVVDYMTNLYSLQTSGASPGLEDYGLRISGYLVPPVSGSYYFRVTSDDEGRFYLSTDDNSTNLQLVTRYSDGICCANQAGAAAGPVGGPVSLVAGRAYYMEGLLKEGGGGDNWHVMWSNSVNQAFTDIASSNLFYAVWPAAVLSVTQAPVNVVVNDGLPATFSLGAYSSEPFLVRPALVYQWFSNDLAIANATNASYTIPATAPDMSGFFSCMTTSRVECSAALGGTYTTWASNAATLTVISDTTAPFVTSVRGDDTFTHIYLTFSEPVTSGSANLSANYTISGGLTVLGGGVASGREQCGAHHLAASDGRGLFGHEQQHS